MRKTIVALAILATVGCVANGQEAKPEPDPKQPPSVAVQANVPPAVPEPQKPEAAALPQVIPGTSGNLVRFELAEGIVDREPTGIATTFSRATTPRVFAFLEIGNKHGEPFELEVRFERVEGTIGRGFKLTIPAAERWRTQALTATRKPGRYRAVVVAPDGSEVANREFDVTE